jgi:hypothetical protein
MQFPQANMIPGRYLGIVRTTGDAFISIALPDSANQSICLHQSVIQSRDPNNRDPYVECNREEPEAYNEDETIESNGEGEEVDIREMPHDETIIDSTGTSQFATHAGDTEFNQENKEEIHNHLDLEQNVRTLKISSAQHSTIRMANCI